MLICRLFLFNFKYSRYIIGCYLIFDPDIYIYIYRQYIFICLRNYLTFSTKGTIIFLFCLDLHCILVITLFDNEHEVQCFVSYEFSFKNGLHSSLMINIKIFFKHLNNILLILVILHKIVIDLHKD